MKKVTHHNNNLNINNIVGNLRHTCGAQSLKV